MPDPVAASSPTSSLIEGGFARSPLLALGADPRNAICSTKDGRAFLTPQLCDLEDDRTFTSFSEAVARQLQALGAPPKAVAHESSPEALSSRWALRSGLPRVPVQHHHAHVAACLAEHGRTGPVIGVVFDEATRGPTGELWGGEILLADLERFERLGHLRAIPLPGGRASRQKPWRVACVALEDAGISTEILPRMDPDAVKTVRRWKTLRSISPGSSDAESWFSTVACLRGLPAENGDAVRILGEVANVSASSPYELDISVDGGLDVVDLRPMVREIAADVLAEVSTSEIAARFIETFAWAIQASCERARRRSGVGTVALTGRCFGNLRLTGRACELLERSGFEVLRHERVPPDDLGLALGQAAVAAHRIGQG